MGGSIKPGVKRSAMPGMDAEMIIPTREMGGSDWLASVARFTGLAVTALATPR
jgi:hypothetical protein